MSKPLILVTNDDSIYSKGIKALVEAMSEIGEFKGELIFLMILKFLT